MILTSTTFREANLSDSEVIWLIIKQAIERRRLDGSRQWQDGYPNPQVIEKDISNHHGYVLLLENVIVAYVAMMINNEPAYDTIDGKWLTEKGDFLVLHRVAVENNFLGKGIAKQLFTEAEKWAKNKKIHSIRVDTNFDNPAMLHIFTKLGYVYCGEVVLRGNIRKAFEKTII